MEITAAYINAALVTFTRNHLLAALQKYLGSMVDAAQLEDWANAIECREDIDFEAGHEDMLQQAIFQLANPLLTVPITEHSVQVLMEKMA